MEKNDKIKTEMSRVPTEVPTFLKTNIKMKKQKKDKVEKILQQKTPPKKTATATQTTPQKRQNFKATNLFQKWQQSSRPVIEQDNWEQIMSSPPTTAPPPPINLLNDSPSPTSRRPPVDVLPLILISSSSDSSPETQPSIPNSITETKHVITPSSMMVVLFTHRMRKLNNSVKIVEKRRKNMKVLIVFFFNV
jgi:hypothetical protein